MTLVSKRTKRLLVTRLDALREVATWDLTQHFFISVDDFRFSRPFGVEERRGSDEWGSLSTEWT